MISMIFLLYSLVIVTSHDDFSTTHIQKNLRNVLSGSFFITVMTSSFSDDNGEKS